jgi:hypothetical protein
VAISDKLLVAAGGLVRGEPLKARKRRAVVLVQVSKSGGSRHALVSAESGVRERLAD